MEKGNPWMIASVTSLGAFLSTLNSTTLNVALPTLMQELHVPVTDVGWVIMSYMLAMSLCVIHAGKLSDLFGRKRVYVTGVAILVVASLLAGFVQSIIGIIVLRALQGIGASAMAANTTAIVVDAFPVNRRGTGLGFNSMSYSVGAVFGPMVGGMLLDLGWQWIFWFNVPVGILLVVWASRTLPSDRRKKILLPFDILGTVWLLVFLVSMLGVITYGMDGAWPLELICLLLAFSILGLFMFIQAEKKAHDPIIQLANFANRIYAIANASTFLNALARMSVSFVLIFYLQGARGFSAFDAGLMVIPMAATMTLVGPLSGRLSDRVGSRMPTTVGLLLSTLGLLALGGLSADTSIWYMTSCLVVIGAGSALFQSPNALSIMSAVPLEQRGVAGGTRMMLNNLGTLLSMSIAAGLLSRVIPQQQTKEHLIPHDQMLPFLSAIHLVFIGGALISLIAMGLSWLREPVSEKLNL
ncbi:MFS transporter [Brevibacillus nitrificans]|uniref:MFS transporter n=1 Tax=Brevibacillus nitrificans TaxID=651560 RepID=UPI0026076E29|nr:MFS transporter [Brevibacillus nitrificans]